MERGLIIKKILFVVIAVCFSVTVNASVELTYLDDGTYRSSPSPGTSPILIELGAPISPLFENNYLINLKLWAIKED